MKDSLRIGIIVAMGKELDLLLRVAGDCSEVEINGFRFFTGAIGPREIVVMQCGIGKVNAALGAMTMIENFHPNVVINSGVAGGTGSDVSILDVVLASGVAYHDVWCGPGTEWGEAAGCPAVFACPIDAVQTAAQLGAKTGLVASGDIFVANADDLARILRVQPEAVAVDMESGAIAQTCHLKGVPFICLRVVSDTPGQADNIGQYNDFWTDAPQHTFDALKRLIEII